jgi:ribosomal-protein-alanine N-acetyltransferase
MSFAERKITDLSELRDLASRLGGRIKTLTPLLEQVQSVHDMVKELDKTLERYPHALDRLLREEREMAREVQVIQRGRVEAQELIDDGKEQISQAIGRLCQASVEIAQRFSPLVEIPGLIREFPQQQSTRKFYLSELQERVEALSGLSRVFARRLEESAAEHIDGEGLPFLFTSQQGTPFESVAGRVASFGSDLRKLRKWIRDGQALGAQVLSHLDQEDALLDQTQTLSRKIEQLRQGELSTLEQVDDARRQARELGEKLKSGLDQIMQELEACILRCQGSTRTASMLNGDLKRVLEILSKEQSVEIALGGPSARAALEQRFWNVTLVCNHVERIAAISSQLPSAEVRRPKTRKELAVEPRYMIPRDVAEVLAIDAVSFDRPWSSEDLLKALRPRNVLGNVLDIDSEIRGYLLWEMRKSTLQILRLAVHPNSRHQGVGRLFVEKLIGKLSGPSSTRSRVIVDVPEESLDAQVFFRALGFRAVSISEDGRSYRMEYNKADHV